MAIPSRQTTQPIVDGPLPICRGYQQLDSTALGAPSALTLPEGTTMVVLQVEGVSVRYRADGVDPTSTQPTTTVRGEPHTLSTWGAKALRTNVTVGLFRAAQLFQASALSYTTTVVGVGREAKLRVGRFRAALKTRKY